MLNWIFKNKEHFQASTFEPQRKISNNVVCATSKASDQPAHMRSLFTSPLNILWL